MSFWRLFDSSGKHIPPNKVKVYQIWGGSPLNTPRIGKETDYTFEFNKDNTGEVSQKIFYSLEEAKEWWSSYPNW